MQSNIMNRCYNIIRVLSNRKLFLIVGILVLSSFFIPEVKAAGLDFLGNKIKSKIGDVSEVVKGVCAASFLLGWAWVLFSLIRAEPNYKYAFCLIIAGAGFWGIAHLVSWGVS